MNDYNTRLMRNNKELDEIYEAILSLPESEADVIRLQYAPGDTMNNVEEVYQAYQNGKYILAEGEHTFFSTKTGNTVTATFSIPLISASSDYIFEFKGADSYDNVIYFGYLPASGWLDLFIERGDPKLQDKRITPNEYTQVIMADEDYDGLGIVVVDEIPDEYIIPSGTKNITTNGTHDVKNYTSASVNVPVPEGYIKPSGTLEIVENGEYDVADKAGVIVSVASGGTAAVEEKDVNFYDYDGTLLYSYTLDEIQNLTELPPVPDYHAELVPYGWNWSLATLKAEKYPIDVGAMYDTNDSKAHLHITIDEYVSKLLSITLHAVGSTTTAYIDWGDGSVETISLTTTSTAFSHSYDNHGDYVIKVWGNEMVYLGYYSGSTNIFGDSTTYSPNCTLLRKVFSGTKCGAGRYAFGYCSALEYATLNPTWGVSYGMFAQSDNLVCCHMASQGNVNGYYIFQHCNSLRIATVSENTLYIQTGFIRDCASLKRIRPKRSAYISEGYNCYQAYTIQEMRGRLSSGNTAAFQSCYCLRKFEIYETSPAIPQACFNSCYVLQSLDIPASVTSIGAQAFQNCHSMRKIRFNSTTPPTVANSNAFTSIPTDCIVEVPAGTLATYQAATNYSTISAQMVEV